MRPFVVMLFVCLIIGAGGSGTMAAASIESSAQQPDCDKVPTGVATQDYWLRFNVPPGLMPDPQFDGLPAKLQVHRVRPVYANGKCSGVATKAAVLIHARTVPGPVLYDLREPATGGGALSVQEGLARAGIDTFVPSLLGYGRSTRFDEGLNDPGNASLPECPTGVTPPPPPECDLTPNRVIFPPDQQRNELIPNPLAATRAHSSNFRFARTDVWVRDIDHVIHDAIDRTNATYRGDGSGETQVALVAYSLGGQTVGRALYANEYVRQKVSRVVFLNSLFGGPTEEPANITSPTFPLTLTDRSGSDSAWRMSQDRETACTGHVIPGTQEQVWAQVMDSDVVGREWGGDDPTHPTGLLRSPTFSGYGWNNTVAGQLSTPTLVMQGLDDTVLPTGPTTGQAIYNALLSAEQKVLVQVECASHALMWEGCAQTTPIPARCTLASGEAPYGGTQGRPWDGPQATFKAALIEWIKKGTFNNEQNGSFIVDESGVARAAAP